MYVSKVADILAVSAQHVYELIRRGELAAIKIGARGIRVTRKSLEEFLNRNRIEG